LETFWRDAAYAVRTLWRNPGFTTIAVMALALGIGANTAVFTVVRGVLLRPLPFPEPERLLLASYQSPNSPFLRQPSMSDRNYLQYAPRQRSFETLTTFG